MSMSDRDGSVHQSRDVVVIGAGPAGSIVARQLALSKLDVLLVERKEFPRRKVCGCCLNARAWQGLQSVGLEDALNVLEPVELDRLALRACGRRVELPMPKGKAVSRSAMDFALLQAAEEAGAEVRTRAAATVGEVRDGRRRVSIGTDESSHKLDVAAQVVVVADGLGHPSLKSLAEFSSAATAVASEIAAGSRLGAGCEIARVPPEFERGAIHMLVGRDGYVGMTQLETGAWNIAAALDRAAVKRCGGLGSVAEQVAIEATRQGWDFLAAADWSGTPELTREPVCVASERMFVVGDAAGYVEPFTGEGMAGAIESAISVCELVNRGVANWQSEWAAQWTVRHRQLVRQRAWLCRGLASLLRRPWWVRGAINVLQHWPSLAAPLIRSLNQPTRLNAVSGQSEPARDMLPCDIERHL